MELTLSTYLIVLPLVFLAGFIDSAAGGGGLISLPAYLAAGLPAHMAAGTNKLSASIGTATAVARFGQGHHLSWRVGLVSAAAALPASFLGASLQQRFDDRTLRIVLLCILPPAALGVLSWHGKTQTRLRVSSGMTVPVSLLIGAVIGFYDGLIGPGTGTFLIILFTSLLGLSPVDASGTAKIVNLSSNIAALVSYLRLGQVLFLLGLPAACMSTLGSLLGSTLAIRKGSGFIRIMLLIVLGLLLAKILVDVLS